LDPCGSKAGPIERVNKLGSFSAISFIAASFAALTTTCSSSCPSNANDNSIEAPSTII
jgi:hypothetical protein